MPRDSMSFYLHRLTSRGFFLMTHVARHSGLDPTACYAFGDGSGNVEFLRSLGHPLVINPITGMRGIARRRHWSVVRWR